MLNKNLSIKDHRMSETPEESWRIYQRRYYVKNNKDKDTRLKTIKERKLFIFEVQKTVINFTVGILNWTKIQNQNGHI